MPRPLLAAEFTIAAGATSFSSNDSNWSFCSAINGETTTVGPPISNAAIS